MPDQVPPEVVRERFQRLLELQERVSLEANRALVGSQVELLVERSASKTDPTRMSGRTRTNKLCHFPAPAGPGVEGRPTGPAAPGVGPGGPGIGAGGLGGGPGRPGIGAGGPRVGPGRPGIGAGGPEFGAGDPTVGSGGPTSGARGPGPGRPVGGDGVAPGDLVTVLVEQAAPHHLVGGPVLRHRPWRPAAGSCAVAPPPRPLPAGAVPLPLVG